MFVLSCNDCGGRLILDELATVDEYTKDMDYIVDEIGDLLEKSIQKYLIYRCADCHTTDKFTYKEWEERMRMKIAKEAMGLRKQIMFSRDINPNNLDPDNGLEYCGQCDGYDGEGNCLVDLIKQCTIRKDK